jgi:hypothetical protein
MINITVKFSSEHVEACVTFEKTHLPVGSLTNRWQLKTSLRYDIFWGKLRLIENGLMAKDVPLWDVFKEAGYYLTV